MFLLIRILLQDGYFNRGCGGRLVTELQWDIAKRRMNEEMYQCLYEKSVDEVVEFVIELAKSSADA